MIELPPGPELDALVAERVMGLKPEDPIYNGLLTVEDLRFSTDWEAMRLVVEKMREWDFVIEMTVSPYGIGVGMTCIRPWIDARAQAETLPHAVCLAALKAKEAM